jgi:hypothetical protein
VTLLKFLPIISAVTLFFGVTKIFYVFRARAMRAFAVSWGLQYVGPAAPKWWNPSHHRKFSPPLPGWFALACHPSGRRITQVWNVIEANQNGISVFIFDGILGEGRGSALCTVIACQTEQNPFGMISSPDRLIQSHGWTVVHGVWFLWFSWTIGIKRVEKHVNKLRVGSVCEPAC